jgi:hypothetical protein
MNRFDRITLTIALVAVALNAVAFGLPQMFVYLFGWGGVIALAIGVALAHLRICVGQGRVPAWLGLLAITAGMFWRWASAPRRRQAVRVRGLAR